MRRTASVLFLSFALALTLTSCGSGQNAATRTITQVTDGVEETIDVEGNKIKIVNFLLVATEDGSAVVVGTIVNTGESEDQILGISVAGSQATLTGETILKPDQPLRFEGDSANAKAVFPVVGAKAGTNVDVTIGFARAGLVTVEALIRDKRDDYANVTAG
jgi:copper(I)-binding protein